VLISLSHSAVVRRLSRGARSQRPRFPFGGDRGPRDWPEWL